jgi:hypothetical protein
VLLMAGVLGLALLGACEEEVQTCVDCAAQEVPNEGWKHVEVGSEITWANNPPASGPHYPYWAQYGIFAEAVPRGYWVHNIEHGTVVLLYRPDAPEEAIASVKAAYNALPTDPECGLKRAVLTPDPELDTPVAAVAADHVIKGETLDADDVLNLYQHCRCTAPEDICAEGAYP